MKITDKLSQDIGKVLRLSAPNAIRFVELAIV
jgi:hypothetical protein